MMAHETYVEEFLVEAKKHEAREAKEQAIYFKAHGLVAGFDAGKCYNNSAFRQGHSAKQTPPKEYGEDKIPVFLTNDSCRQAPELFMVTNVLLVIGGRTALLLNHRGIFDNQGNALELDSLERVERTIEWLESELASELALVQMSDGPPPLTV